MEPSRAIEEPEYGVGQTIRVVLRKVDPSGHEKVLDSNIRTNAASSMASVAPITSSSTQV